METLKDCLLANLCDKYSLTANTNYSPLLLLLSLLCIIFACRRLEISRAGARAGLYTLLKKSRAFFCRCRSSRESMASLFLCCWRIRARIKWIQCYLIVFVSLWLKKNLHTVLTQRLDNIIHIVTENSEAIIIETIVTPVVISLQDDTINDRSLFSHSVVLFFAYPKQLVVHIKVSKSLFYWALLTHASLCLRRQSKDLACCHVDRLRDVSANVSDRNLKHNVLTLQ